VAEIEDLETRITELELESDLLRTDSKNRIAQILDAQAESSELEQQEQAEAEAEHQQVVDGVVVFVCVDGVGVWLCLAVCTEWLCLAV
jgi:hypothetical protein